MDKTLFILLEQLDLLCFSFFLYDAHVSVCARWLSVCALRVRFRNHHHVWLTITLSDDGDRIFMSVYAMHCCLRIKTSAPNFILFFFLPRLLFPLHHNSSFFSLASLCFCFFFRYCFYSLWPCDWEKKHTHREPSPTSTSQIYTVKLQHT